MDEHYEPNAKIAAHGDLGGCRQRAAHVVPLASALDKRGLTLEDLERILQARDLGLAARFAGLISLWLGDATLVDLGEILEHRLELSAGTITVGRKLADVLVQANGFLSLVLHVLTLGRRGDLVLLGGLLIVFLRSRFAGLLLRQVGCKVRLDNLEDANDASASTVRGSEQRWLLWLLHEGSLLARSIIIADHNQSLADTSEAQLQVLLRLDVVRVCLLANLAHLSLLLCQG